MYYVCLFVCLSLFVCLFVCLSLFVCFTGNLGDWVLWRGGSWLLFEVVVWCWLCYFFYLTLKLYLLTYLEEHMCERCMWTVVSDSVECRHCIRPCDWRTDHSDSDTPAYGRNAITSPAHAARSYQRQRTLSLFRSHAIHCLVPCSFPTKRRCCVCLLNLPCWLHIKFLFVPKLAVPKRKQLDRVKVNLSPKPRSRED